MAARRGTRIVLRVRLERLAEAIRDRDWPEVERQHDRVRRAVEKLDREVDDAVVLTGEQAERLHRAMAPVRAALLEEKEETR